MKDEPDTQEFLRAVVDFVGSILLIDVIWRKVSAQSYGEFFNRLIGVGIILFGLGLLTLVLEGLTGSGALVIFGIDIRNYLLPLIIISVLWVGLILIKLTNLGLSVETVAALRREDIVEGQDIVFNFDTVSIEFVYHGIRLFMGIAILVSMFQNVFSTNDPTLVEWVATMMKFGIFMGFFLIGVGYFLGGISGYINMGRQEWRWRAR